MGQLPMPDPALAAELGVTNWLVMAAFMFGAATIAFFANRAMKSLDRMASAIEHMGGLREAVTTKLDTMDGKLDTLEDLSRRNLNIAELWAKTEGPGRVLKPENQS